MAMVILTVKVPAELREALETLAESTDRTVAAEVRRAIRKHLADAEREAAQATA